MKDMPHQFDAVLSELADLQSRATEGLRAAVSSAGKVDAEALERHQHAAHALSWLATYVESLRQLAGWSGRVSGEIEDLITRIGFGEYLTQIAGGIPMSQTEFARLSDLGLDWQPSDAARALMAGNTPEARARLAALIAENKGSATFGASGLDEDLEMIRDQFRRLQGELAPGAYVLVARPSARQADNSALRDGFLRLLQRAGALPVATPAGTMPADDPSPLPPDAPASTGP